MGRKDKTSHTGRVPSTAAVYPHSCEKIPAHLEPTGISRSDGKRPDGATIVPWKGGRVLVWDATCPDTFALSHITLATREADAVTDEAERKKKQKYSSLMTGHHFVPIAIETSGVFGSEAITFFKGVGPTD